MDKPEALRLADELDGMPVNEFYEALGDEAADELRRLHAENEMLHQRHRDDNVEYTRVLAQRDALLEALAALMDEQSGPPLIRRHRQWQAAMDKASAAIKAVEEGNT